MRRHRPEAEHVAGCHLAWTAAEWTHGILGHDPNRCPDAARYHTVRRVLDAAAPQLGDAVESYLATRRTP